MIGDWRLGPAVAGRAHARIGEWGMVIRDWWLGIGEWGMVIRVLVVGDWGIVIGERINHE